MEGYIQVTQESHDLLQQTRSYPFVKRGAFEIKGKGTMTTYLLNVPQYLEDKLGVDG